MKSLFLLSLLFFCFIKSVYCQLESNWWYFGSNAGIEFTGGSPVPAFDGATFSSEGTASISDLNTGDLLFYTDGITVYDASHNQMPNGSGLLGNSSSTQAALIVPKPESDNIFYIFTTDANENAGTNGFLYSVVDMTLNGGMGDITSEKNELLFAPCSEQISAVKHANCIDWWIMAKEFSSNTYKAYLLSNSGLSAPVTNTIGLTNIVLSYGQAKFTPDGTKYGIALNRLVQLFDFDKSTGILSNFIDLTPSDISEDTYGLSFSSDNNKLYVMRGAGATELYQYDVSSGSAPIILASATSIGLNNSSYNQLQLARDYKIYIANQFGGNLSVINNPNLPGTDCNYSSETIPIAGSGYIGLCNFPDSYFNETSSCSFNITANYDSISCHDANDAVAWVGTSGGIPPFTYSWAPGGSTNDTIFDLGPGTYVVTVTDSTNLAVIDSVTITEPNLLTVDVTAVDDTICENTNASLNSAVVGDFTPYTYSWSVGTGNTLPTFNNELTSSGYVNLTVTDAHSCIAKDSIFIAVINLPVMDVIVENASCADVCDGKITVNTSSNHLISFDGGINFNSSSELVDCSGSFDIVVKSSDGCTSNESVNFIKPEPFVANFIMSPEQTNVSEPEIKFINFSGPSEVDISTWIFGNNPILGTSTQENPTFSFPSDNEGNYPIQLIAINQNGCIDSITKNIIVLGDLTFFIPNTFTPNGDGLNDVFKPVLNAVDVNDYSFEIYNRWGERIFETTDVNKGWNGTGKDGEFIAPNGVYVYSIQMSSKYSTKRKDVKGQVNVSR